MVCDHTGGLVKPWGGHRMLTGSPSTWTASQGCPQTSHQVHIRTLSVPGPCQTVESPDRKGRCLSGRCGPRPFFPLLGGGMEQSKPTPTHLHICPSCEWLGLCVAGCGDSQEQVCLERPEASLSGCALSIRHLITSYVYLFCMYAR